MHTKVVLRLPNQITKVEPKLLSLKIGTCFFPIETNTEKITEILLRLNTGINEKSIYAILKKINKDSAIRLKDLISSLNENCCLDYHFFQDVKRFNPLFIVLPKKPCLMPQKNGFYNKKVNKLSDRYILSRFSYFRSVDGGIFLEHPFSKVNILFKNRELVDLLLSFVNPSLLKTLWGKNNLDRVGKALATILVENHFIQFENAPIKDTHKMWSFHDLLFHKHSRIQEFPYPNNFGASFPYPQFAKLLPNFKEPINQSKITLFKPSLKMLGKNDPTLTQVLEQRHSDRQHGLQPITKKQLSELLYRVFHIKEIKVIEGQQQQYRVYPSAGGQHELEVYVLVNNCEKLKRDIYHYRPIENMLYCLNSPAKYVDEMLKLAACAWGNKNHLPQALLIFSSRFPKQFWKYEGIGYRNTLVSAGAAMQTVYLVAEAMGLAACCLGYGCSDLFSKVIQADPFEESSILEIAIGRK